MVFLFCLPIRLSWAAGVSDSASKQARTKQSKEHSQQRQRGQSRRAGEHSRLLSPALAAKGSQRWPPKVHGRWRSKRASPSSAGDADLYRNAHLHRPPKAHSYHFALSISPVPAPVWGRGRNTDSSRRWRPDAALAAMSISTIEREIRASASVSRYWRAWVTASS